MFIVIGISTKAKLGQFTLPPVFILKVIEPIKFASPSIKQSISGSAPTLK